MSDVRLLGRAAAELDEAVAWYQARSPQSARRFKAAVTASLGRIGAFPEAYALENDKQRLCPIVKFRYVFVYEYDTATDEVVVVALVNPTQGAPDW